MSDQLYPTATGVCACQSLVKVFTGEDSQVEAITGKGGRRYGYNLNVKNEAAMNVHVSHLIGSNLHV